MHWGLMNIPIIPVYAITRVPWWVSSVRPERGGRQARPLDGQASDSDENSDKDSDEKKVRGPDPAGSESVIGQVYYLSDYRFKK
jgi:hypothetical protein